MDPLILGIIIFGLVYYYISGRQYLVKDGFTCGGSAVSSPYVSWPGGVMSPPPYGSQANPCVNCKRAQCPYAKIGYCPFQRTGLCHFKSIDD